MSADLTQQNWLATYKTDTNNIAEEFFVPALQQSVRYDRISGYYNAAVLQLVMRGIQGLVSNSGKIRLIISPHLSPEDVEAIRNGYDERERITAALLNANLDWNGPTDSLRLLTWLIASRHLEIKIAVCVEPGVGITSGIFHAKEGLIYDTLGNAVYFNGSNNETHAAHVSNYEKFMVFCSWSSAESQARVEEGKADFERLWTNGSAALKIFDFPEAARIRLFERFPPEPPQRAHIVLPEAEVAPAAIDWRSRYWGAVKQSYSRSDAWVTSAMTAAVEPWPHQWRTLQKAAATDRLRIMIADEVGLGKTVSAGLIIRYFWLSGRAKRILLLGPKAVLSQWQNELYEKFNLNVPIYDGRSLHYRHTPGWQESSAGEPSEIIVGRDWHKSPFVIAGSQLLRRQDRDTDFEEAADWDLVVLDESHHARRSGAGQAGEKGPNLLLRRMQKLAARTQNLLLLTATPMQIAPVELYDLLDLLGLPPEWTAENFLKYFELLSGAPGDQDMIFLKRMFTSIADEYAWPNEGQLAARLTEMERASTRQIWPALRNRSDIPIRSLRLNDRKVFTKLMQAFSPVYFLVIRNTRELLRQYRDRGFIDSVIPDRKVHDEPITMTEVERQLYRDVEAFIQRIYSQASRTQNKGAVGFILTVFRRRLASSFAALKATFARRLNNIAEKVLEEDFAEDDGTESIFSDAENIARLSSAGDSELTAERDEIIKFLQRLDRISSDSKTEKLIDLIGHYLANERNQVMVFTQFTDTLDYLKETLSLKFPNVTLGYFTGPQCAVRNSSEWKKKERDEIKRLFRDQKINILLCTDSAAEGLNFQSCGVLINYDLPWNPMRVEQRIGRIDRIGQRYPDIHIHNFAYKATVEADIYFDLQSRINLFERMVGRLQPILSRLSSEFEKIVLTIPDDEPDEREKALNELRAEIVSLQNDGFDIDSGIELMQEKPVIPEPAFTIDDLEKGMNHPEIRPDNIGWEARDNHSFEFIKPGWQKAVRMATSASVFEFNFSSVELFSPGNPVFDDIVKTCSSGGSEDHDEKPGRIVMKAQSASSATTLT